MSDVDTNRDEEKVEFDALENSGVSSLASDWGVNERKLLAKLDWRILPAVSFLYLLSFLDRSNVANARIDGLVADIYMTGDQYLTGLTLFFIGYISFEIPCNIILKRTTPRFWLPTITFIWGVVSTLQGVISTLAGFYVVRTFLGVAEGGLFPGVVFYLSMWYKRQERQFRIALFFSAASLAGAFGGILAYGINYMNGVGGLLGWRWIFILEGLFTCVVSICAYFFIHNYPDTAKFLTSNERNFVQYRLKADSDANNDEGFQWANVAAALKDPKCWLYCFAFHTMSLPLYTLSLFLPTIILSLGYSSATAQLMTVPPYALATIFTVVIAFTSERVRMRAPFMMATSALAVIGYIILLSNTALIPGTTTNPATGAPMATLVYAKPGISYVGMFFCAAGIYPSTALALSWPAVNVSGQTKRATAGAMQISIGNLGAVIGTQLYRTETAPLYVLGHSFALGYLCLNVCVGGFTWWYLKRENRKREAAGVAAGVAAAVGEVGGEGWKGDDDLRWRFTV